jgi:outer membrane immunogenic protein
MTWTGFYVGGNIGGGWRSRNNAGGSVVGGVQAGDNYQLTPLFVAGVETDFQGASIGNTSWNTPYPVDPADRIHWFGAVRGRLGVTAFSPNLLVYGTGGFAYGEVRSPWSGYSNVRAGWTAGGGLEYLVSPNWSAKVEYLYTDLSTDNSGWGWNGHHGHTKFHKLRAGVNYHFNLFNSAPVLAKY